MPRDIDARAIFRLVIVRFEGLEAEAPATAKIASAAARVQDVHADIVCYALND